GPAIGTRHTPLRVLAPPVAGADWVAAGGPGNHSHHRVGLIVDEGGAYLSRRHAIDWRQTRDGARFIGDALDTRAYYAYGEPVFAVADGTVVRAMDGLPDNIPRTAAGFSTALPLTMENIAGNAITLDLGDGQFAYYAHLQAGSLLVGEGDRVKRGQALGRIGNSGDSREPHLHFQVTNAPGVLASEGLPYVIDRYRARSADGRWEERRNELPLADMAVEFAPAPDGSDCPLAAASRAGKPVSGASEGCLGCTAAGLFAASPRRYCEA
ncbi:MAG: M23 family metallopeptidase, partial [Pseudomonadota bacterium]|nr:M23 family metallopeptidase [Pseudomonadota bacterium]